MNEISAEKDYTHTVILPLLSASKKLQKAVEHVLSLSQNLFLLYGHSLELPTLQQCEWSQHVTLESYSWYTLGSLPNLTLHSLLSYIQFFRD